MAHVEVFLTVSEVAAAFAALSLLVTALRVANRDIPHPAHLTGQFSPHFNAILVIAMLTLLTWNVVAPGSRAEAGYLLALLLLPTYAGVLFISAAFVMRVQVGTPRS